MAKMTMIQALNTGLRQEMERDDRVIVLGEDVGVDGGVFRATDGLIEQFGADFVVLDALADVFGGNENDRGQARQFVSLLKQLNDQLGTTLLLVTHDK